ncbi:MAG: hypothetical protein LBU39_10355 [Desulfobulbaceae bacterium]|nr:hypothetical protein [Desulfobulbaceae bacterium]
MARENGIPFKPTGDPFSSERNLAALGRSIAQLDSGQTVTKTLHEVGNVAE